MSTRVPGAKVSVAVRRAVALKGAALAAVALSSLLAQQAAVAQSTGTIATEDELTEVTVTARRGPRAIGNVTEQNAPKSRVTITEEYLESQAAGQTVFQSLNLVPGVNFTNSDPYGSAGGNLRIRSFDGSRVSVTFDGVPLNDSGNYALFTNQMLDPELISAADVNLGTTDVDSPTASATGGTVAYRTRRPNEETSAMAVLSKGDFGYNRIFASVDSGAFGPWGTTAFVSASYQDYNKFKGPGELFKRQYNGKLYQDLGDRGFMALSAHFNKNRNNFYRNASAANFALFGRDYDNLATCTRDLPTPGVADNDNATLVAGTTTLPANDNPANPASCTNFFELRINPSDTGNIRGQSLWNLTDRVKLTFDPSFQYVLANGGGTNTLVETPSATATDRRVIGASTTAMGVDVNGDGDLLDTVRFYTPNTTNTRRWGLTSSVIWDISDVHRVRASYTLDYARHRQTAQWGFVAADGRPENVFAGRDGRPVLAADGSEIRGRDRLSIAELNQLAAEYRGKFLDDALTVNVGVRAPEFTRELNQYCYTPNAGTGNSGTNPGTNGTLCTTQTPVVTLPNGNVRFSTLATAPELVPPFSETLKFDDVLPNVGATWKFAGNHTVYASYAEGLSAPRTDNLYSVRRTATSSTILRPLPDPETTKSIDLGWRYNSDTFLASIAVWRTDYSNRIVQAFDEELGFSVDRNLGEVDLQGFDAQIGWQPLDTFTITASASYNESEVQDDPRSTADNTAGIVGKTLVETPDWTFATRLDWAPSKSFRMGLQGKYVGDRFATDNNNEVAPSYTLWDLDATWELPVDNVKRLALQFNIINLLDEEYFGNISSGTGLGTSVGFFQIGVPRTAMVSARIEF
jgi:iron complex outermembrane receptor protein